MSMSLPPLYRLVRGQEAQAHDFASVMVSGIREPNAIEREQPEIWAGVSMFSTEAAARKVGQKRPSLGEWIARVEGVDPGWIVIGSAGRRGHHTVWASPIRLHASVTAVVPV